MQICWHANLLSLRGSFSDLAMTKAIFTIVEKRKTMKQFLKPSHVLSGAVLAFAMSAFSANAMAQENIALGKTVEFSATPNYALCTDTDDLKQLTDGKFSSRGDLQEVENTTNIWTQKGTVGWSGKFPVITIDLGKVQPISGIAYSTGAGRAGVEWPSNIYLAVSDDKTNWSYLGDLRELSKAQPPAEGYAAFQYVTHDLRTKGRYVALAIASSQYVFTDEIEVFRGQENWLNEPAGGETTENLQTLVFRTVIGERVRKRLDADISAMREKVAQSGLDADRRSAQDALLTAQQMAVKDITLPPLSLKTILPLNDTHERIFALHGELLKAKGYAPLTIWKTHRYAWLPLLSAPPKNSAPVALNFSVLRNQHRSDALLLTNAGVLPRRFRCKFPIRRVAHKQGGCKFLPLRGRTRATAFPSRMRCSRQQRKTGFPKSKFPLA